MSVRPEQHLESRTITGGGVGAVACAEMTAAEILRLATAAKRAVVREASRLCRLRSRLGLGARGPLRDRLLVHDRDEGQETVVLLGAGYFGRSAQRIWLSSTGGQKLRSRGRG